MALTAGELKQAMQAFMRLITDDPSAFDKAALTAATAAVDQWVTDNAAAFNSALPAAYRSTATANQKAALLALVCMLRAGRPLPEGL